VQSVFSGFQWFYIRVAALAPRPNGPFYPVKPLIVHIERLDSHVGWHNTRIEPPHGLVLPQPGFYQCLPRFDLPGVVEAEKLESGTPYGGLSNNQSAL
jgi:hypothetical protein